MSVPASADRTPDGIQDLLPGRPGDWTAVGHGESGDRVFRRSDGRAYAKLTTSARAAALAGERDRLVWLAMYDLPAPKMLDWRMGDDAACLVMTTVPGVPASALSGADLLAAWPSIVDTVRDLHALPGMACPFERGLARMYAQAESVVRRGAVNPAFLASADQNVSADQLLARLATDLPARMAQEVADLTVCHGDACMPNIMVDRRTHCCTGLIDLGRLGTADRYADLSLLIANASESWSSEKEADAAFRMLFEGLGIANPDRERLAFYLRLDPLTWG